MPLEVIPLDADTSSPPEHFNATGAISASAHPEQSLCVLSWKSHFHIVSTVERTKIDDSKGWLFAKFAQKLCLLCSISSGSTILTVSCNVNYQLVESILRAKEIDWIFRLNLQKRGEVPGHYPREQEKKSPLSLSPATNNEHLGVVGQILVMACTSFCVCLQVISHERKLGSIS